MLTSEREKILRQDPNDHVREILKELDRAKQKINSLLENEIKVISLTERLKRSNQIIHNLIDAFETSNESNEINVRISSLAKRIQKSRNYMLIALEVLGECSDSKEEKTSSTIENEEKIKTNLVYLIKQSLECLDIFKI